MKRLGAYRSFFGLLNEPSTVLIDNVRLEVASSAWETIERPYLLANPGGIESNNFLPLERWVETQPEESRSRLLSNVEVARENGWRGGEGRLKWVAYGVGIASLAAWAIMGVVFVRLRALEWMVRSQVLEKGLVGAMGLAVIAQAATCYLVLFGHPI